MARSLHNDLNSAKNALNNNQAWLVLFDVFVTDSEVLRITNNEESFTFAGNTYSPFPVGFEDFEETASGDLPYITVMVGNTDRVISKYLETHGGLLDRKVVMRIAHQSNTSNVALEVTLMVREVTATDSAANFRLSSHPFMDLDWPFNRYYRHRCRFEFKNAIGCGWTAATGGTGSAETCDKSLDGANGCVAHNNQQRFGGMPGIPKRRI